MIAFWLVRFSFVLSAIFAGSACPEIVGPPDGVGVWQYMEYSHGIRLQFDGPQHGGVTVYISDTDMIQYQFWSTVQIAYRNDADETIFIGSTRISPGASVVQVDGPPVFWSYAIIQAGDIIGFEVDAVQAQPQYRAGLPIIGMGK